MTDLTIDYIKERNELLKKIEQLREALKNMLRWHDQISPADIAKAETALKESE